MREQGISTIGGTLLAGLAGILTAVAITDWVVVDVQIVDPDPAKKVGKLVGASIILIGSFQTLGDVLSINARMVEVETGIFDFLVAEGAFSSGFEDSTNAPLTAAWYGGALIVY